MRTIHYIVVHCSATREDRILTPENLEAEHRRRGFNGIGPRHCNCSYTNY